MGSKQKNLILWVLLILAFILVVQFMKSKPNPEEVPFSRFISDAQTVIVPEGGVPLSGIRHLEIRGEVLIGTLIDGEAFTARGKLESVEGYHDDLVRRGVDVVWLEPRDPLPDSHAAAKVLSFSDLLREGRRIPEVSEVGDPERLAYTQVKQIVVKGETLLVTYHDGAERRSRGRLENYEPQILGVGVKVVHEEEEKDGLLFQFLISWVPMILLFGLFLFFLRQLQAGGGKAMSFGKSKHRVLTQHDATVTFADIAGIDESKEELQEIIDFLRDPKKYTRLGGRIPKGVLLMGPPGTGKTLLARGVAGEAGVPFFSISGSDFVEMFVGVGASRVRDLFEQGKKNAPCIVFIDEIDAVGRHRGAGLGGGHDEREQTLNQLLVEMDGFESNEGVILIAATNRPDVLDPALMRPGRFDRRVVVSLPDVKGRLGILGVHSRKKPLHESVDMGLLARGTPGFSGADLENLLNEAALLAARRNAESIEPTDLEDAKDKVLLGTERRSLVLTEDEKRTTAYHESGHALVAARLEHADPLYKVTIVPRGMALGLTQLLPERDRHGYSRGWVEDTITMLMGGRVAEELVFGMQTTGAGQDIDHATELARKMVCVWGMSNLGPLSYDSQGQQEIFLGKQFSKVRGFSEATAERIDREIKRIVDTAFDRARRIVQEGRAVLDELAEALLERETLDQKDLIEILLRHGLSLRQMKNPEEGAEAGEDTNPEDGDA
ncbi:MAG: ATP-dependent zinc metalloprotease FtsH [Pseudomonadota bacterium]